MYLRWHNIVLLGYTSLNLVRCTCYAFATAHYLSNHGGLEGVLLSLLVISLILCSDPWRITINVWGSAIIDTSTAHVNIEDDILLDEISNGDILLILNHFGLTYASLGLYCLHLWLWRWLGLLIDLCRLIFIIPYSLSILYLLSRCASNLICFVLWRQKLTVLLYFFLGGVKRNLNLTYWWLLLGYLSNILACFALIFEW